eukprot:scaffold8369_cov121-Cylindrotheca_fusiformis.AAC.5
MDPENIATSTQSGEPSGSTRSAAPQKNHPTMITDTSSSKSKRIGVSFTHQKVFLDLALEEGQMCKLKD